MVPLLWGAVIASMISSCASSPDLIAMEPRSFGSRLGFADCRVSVDLTREEIIEIGNRWEVYPNPEGDPEWVKMISLQRPGDELRLIRREKVGSYFYALIRNNEIIFRYHPLILDRQT